MQSHFFTKKKPCPSMVQEIELTDEIKQYVMDNRLYKKTVKQKKIAPQLSVTTIINNFNQINTIQNIVAGIDTKHKLNTYTTFTKTPLVDFESSLESQFSCISDKLDNDEIHHDYMLHYDMLMHIVGTASFPINDRIVSYNVIYDKKLKELHIYDGMWESMSLSNGTKHYVERIQRNFLDSYERYLIRNITSMSIGQKRKLYVEMLEHYYGFIGCFGLAPYFVDSVDEDVIVSERYYPIYTNIVSKLNKPKVNTTIKNMQEMINRNSLKHVIVLNRKITDMFQMHDEFRNMLSIGPT